MRASSSATAGARAMSIAASGRRKPAAYSFSPGVSRNVATVTGACLAVGRDVVDAIGTFNEAYRVVGSDTEFCLRAHLAGLSNVYLPEVVLVHHESQSRSRSDPPADNDLLERFIAEHIPRDPFYNPNLTLSSLHPSLSAEPRFPADP